MFSNAKISSRPNSLDIDLDQKNNLKRAMKTSDSQSKMPPDNYKTYSKRTFRPDYVDPEDNRGVVWFVDVDETFKSRPASPPKRPVIRNETFKVDHRPVINVRSSRGDSVDSPDRYSPPHNIVSRRSMNEPIRVEIKQSDSSVKVVPVGVAMPYNAARNEYSTTSSSARDSPMRSTFYPSSRNEPIKITIDRNSSWKSQSPQQYHHRSSLSPNKSLDKRLTTTIILSDDNNRSHNQSLKSHKNSSSPFSFQPRSQSPEKATFRSPEKGSVLEKSAYYDVLSAVRTPGLFRAVPANNVKPGSATNSPRFVSTVKVKPYRPVWRC